MEIFKKQSLKRILSEANENKERTLSALDLTLMSVGSVIGTGVMVLTGIVAAKQSGPATSIAFIGGGIAAAIIVLCYAEFSSSIPSAGGSYSFTYVSLGEIIAYISGLCIVIGYTLSTATVASGWGAYLLSLLDILGIKLPKTFTAIPSEGGIVNLPAMISILFIVFVISLGTKESKKVNDIMVFIKIAVIALFIGVGAFHVNTSNWHPFAPFGVKGIVTGTASLFFAYCGFDATASAAEEVKNPQKSLPLGLISSLVICTIIYIAVSLVLTGVTSYTNLNVGDALSYALKLVGQSGVAFVVSLGTVIGILAVIFAGNFTTSHILLAMSRDGLLPKFFSKVDKKDVPYTALWTVGIIGALLAGFFNLGQLANFANIAFLLTYTLVCISLIAFRKKYPHVKRGFKTPLVPFIPLLGAFSCLFLMGNLSEETWKIFIVVLALLIISYLVYGRKHSLINKNNDN
ncbi:TPA: amino acid permease [Clostridium perfringens]|nr:amino acid permease [Clostridium perfringens]